MSEPTLSPSLRACFVAAMGDAKARRNEFVTLEHLLLALLREDRTREILRACGADSQKLNRDLKNYLDRDLESLPKNVKSEPEQTMRTSPVAMAGVVGSPTTWARLPR